MSFLSLFRAGHPPPPRTLADALRGELAMPESAVHVIRCWRLLQLGLAKLPGLPLGRVLELRSYSHPGFALLLLMLGAQHVTLNNTRTVRDHLSADWVECLAMLAAIAMPRDHRQFIELDGDGYRIAPRFLSISSATDAATIDASPGSIDFAFSMSVLEHMRRLPDVLGHLHALMRPGATAYHWIRS